MNRSPFPSHDRRRCLYLLVLTFAILSPISETLSPNIKYEGLQCADHPAYDPVWNPVLVRSWALDRLAAADFLQETYLARYTNHTYTPPNDPSSTKYYGLDMFFTAGKTRNPNTRMYFQRDAKVYLMVYVYPKDYNPTVTASLLGWQSEGWARRTSSSYKIEYGIHTKLKRSMPQYVYVFSKYSTDKHIDIPQNRFVMRRIAGLTVSGAFFLLVAERDGSRSRPVGIFNGQTIRPNEPCPPELHDTWYTTDNTLEDSHTSGMKFATWHPTWDPCHWCAYDHDHGSSPKHLFGYEPKYDYVALKNNNEDEAHRGFKGVVFETRQHYVYYNAHVRTSSLRRVTTRFHTIHLVIADRASGEILVDVAHKGDFGFQSVRLKPGHIFKPISDHDRMIMQNQTGARNFRSINIIDVDNLVPEYMYRPGLSLGTYEEWQTRPICAHANNRHHMFRLLFKLASTGIKSETEPDVQINLGQHSQGHLIRSSSLPRTLLLPSIEISDVHCPERRNGIFYTDPFGIPKDGPSPTSLRQYVKPNFRVTLNGRFEPEEVWVGLHGNFRRGFFQDHGYGVNPGEN